MSPSFAPATGKHVSGGNSTSMRWSALNEASLVVAMLAGVSVQRQDKDIRNFAARLRDCDEWRRDAAENGLADLSAILEPGLAALMAINARGNDCRPAAQALWKEFTEARLALLSLLPPTSKMGPLRSA